MLNDKTIEELILSNGFVQEQRWFACPFCATHYIGESERRPVNCPYCLGQGDRAKTLEQYCERKLDEWRNSKDLDSITKLSDNVSGYMQFEFRRTARAIRELIAQPEPEPTPDQEF